MAKISKDELLKLAKISNLALQEDEYAYLQKHVANVLSYAHRVTHVAQQIVMSSEKNSNIFRQDHIVRTDVAPILAQAPEREQNFFVVPAILEKQ